MSEAFVAREHELARLDSYLDRARDGAFQVCLISGEAGTGKTTLLKEFARRSYAADDRVLFLTGKCNSHDGEGDPFLPFRSLGLLSGEDTPGSTETTNRIAERFRSVLKTSGRALVEVAPELVGSVIPGSGILLAIIRMLAQERNLLKVLDERVKDAEANPRAIDQSQIFAQYTAFLRTLSEQLPLVIVLEDLHWIDPASKALFFHLTRELDHCRLLLIGTYRESDVAIGREIRRDSLESVLNEIKYAHGDIGIDLNAVTRTDGRAFVDAVIDVEANTLSPSFRDALHRHTAGHALFTVELLKAMKESGDLLQDAEGRWYESSELDWNELPDRVEKIIEERVKRLEVDLRDVLEVASIHGVDFFAQVVARVQEWRERAVFRYLRELQDLHQLVNETGEIPVGDQRLSQYSFAHALFRRYVYDRIATGERRLLHRQVAVVLELLYDGRDEEIIHRLARHYQEGGEFEKAIDCFIRAAARTLRLGSAKDALATLERAERLYAENGIDRPDLRLSMTYQQAGCHYRLTNRLQAKALLEDALQQSEVCDHPVMRVDILIELSRIVRAFHERQAAHDYTLAAYELAKQVSNDRQMAKALRNLASQYKGTEHVDRALDYYRQALDYARKTEDWLEVLETLNSLAIVYCSTGQVEKGLRHYEEAIEIGEREGLTYNLGMVRSNLAYRQRALGLYDDALASFQSALEIAQRVGSRGQRKIRLHGIGKTYHWQYQFDRALAYYLLAIEIADSLDTPASRVDPYRDIAVLYLQTNELDQAARCIDTALHNSGPQKDQSLLIKGIIELWRGNKTAAKELLEAGLAIVLDDVLKRSPDAQLENFHAFLILAALMVVDDDEAAIADYGRRAEDHLILALAAAPEEKGAIRYRGVDLLGLIATHDSAGRFARFHDMIAAALAD